MGGHVEGSGRGLRVLARGADWRQFGQRGVTFRGMVLPTCGQTPGFVLWKLHSGRVAIPSGCRVKEENMGTALPQGARRRLTAKGGASQLFGMARDASSGALPFSGWGKAMRPVPLMLGAWLGGWVVAGPDGPNWAVRSCLGGMVAKGRTGGVVGVVGLWSTKRCQERR